MAGINTSKFTCSDPDIFKIFTQISLSRLAAAIGITESSSVPAISQFQCRTAIVDKSKLSLHLT